MIKMKIKLDYDKIKKDNIYKNNEFDEKIYSLFTVAGLNNIIYKNNEIICKDNSTDKDFAKFGQVINFLKKQSWFMENVIKWKLYESGDFDGENVEDLLNHYHQK